MSFLNYLILFIFQVCFLADAIDQKEKKYHNQTETSTNLLEQKTEVKNKLNSTSKSSANSNIFFYIPTFFEKIISFVFSKIYQTIDFIINPIKKIKNLFIGSKARTKQEPEVQKNKSLPEDIQNSRENDTQEKPVNSVRL